MTTIEIVSAESLDADVHPPFGQNLTDSGIEWLRTEELYGCYRVDLWDTHRIGKRGQSLIAYRLAWQHDEGNNRDWAIIFSGEDLEPGIGTLIDSDQVLADLLGFLAAYNELESTTCSIEQREWLERHGDELSLWSRDLEGTS